MYYSHYGDQFSNWGVPHQVGEDVATLRVEFGCPTLSMSTVRLCWWVGKS